MFNLWPQVQFIMAALNILCKLKSQEISQSCWSKVIFWVRVQLDHLSVFVVFKEVLDLFLLELRGLRVLPSCSRSQALRVDNAENIEANDHASKKDPVHYLLIYYFLLNYNPN